MTSDRMQRPVLVLNASYEPINICAARRALVLVLKGVASAEERKLIETGAAESVKRVKLTPAEKPSDWLADSAQSLYAIRDLVEFKTTWHPVGW